VTTISGRASVVTIATSATVTITISDRVAGGLLPGEGDGTFNAGGGDPVRHNGRS